MATAATQDQQSQGNGFSLPNIPTSMPNIPGMPKVGDLLHKGEDYLKQLGKQMLKQAVQKIGVFLAANPEIVAILLAIAAVIIFFIIIFIAITGQGNSTVQTTTTAAIDIYNPAPFTGNVDDYFTFVGGTQTQQDALGNDLKIALAYPKYQTLLDIGTKGKVVITLHAGNPTGYNEGWAVTNSPSGNIDLYGEFLSANAETQKLYLLHETAHTIDFRNNLSATFYPIGIKDTTCYDGNGYIKTYPTGQHLPYDKTVAVQESFADSFINTLFCKPGQTCGPNGKVSEDDGSIQDWPTTCANTFSWMVVNMLGVTTSSNNSSMCNNYYTPADTKNSNAITKVNANNPTPRNIYLHKGDNFGDPQCELASTTSGAAARDLEYAYLKKIDPKNADTWFNVIIPCESGYNPLAYQPNSHSTLGGYGLIQTNPGTNPYNGAARVNTSDIGDVSWKQQLQNGVNISKNLTSFSSYWGCGGGVMVVK